MGGADGGVFEHGDEPSLAQSRAEELGDLINGHPENVAEVLPELAALLDVHGDGAALVSVVVALSHVADDRALEVLLRADLSGHGEDRVRLALAEALSSGLPGPEVRDAAVEQLLVLVDDSSSDVRDWACFALGGLNADGPAVRDALVRRLDDPDSMTRAEALRALARTGDERALVRTAQLLAEPELGGINALLLVAAVELAAPELVGVLGEVAAEWDGDEDDHTDLVRRALRRSTAEAAQQAGDAEQRVLARLNEQLADQRRTAFLAGSYPRTTLHFDDEDLRAGWWRRLWADNDPDSVEVEVQATSER